MRDAQPTEIELKDLIKMAITAKSEGASDMEHMDAPAGALNYVRIAEIVSHYYRTGRIKPPILDWGCGYGQVSWLLQRRGVHVVSCDVERRPGREKIPQLRSIDVQYLRDPVQLPYESGSFGAVLSVGVIEHVSDIQRSLSELNRILRPSGCLFVFMLPNRFSWAEAIAEWRRISVHPYKFTLSRTEKLLALHGFEILDSWRRNLLPRNLTGLPQNAKVLYGRFYRHIEFLDGILANLPPFGIFSGVLELVAEKRTPKPDCGFQ